MNAPDQWQYTSLHEAASKGRTEVCAVLLAHGADPTLRNANGKNALELAAQPLRDSISRESRCHPASFDVCLAGDYQGYQLMQACQFGDQARVKRYLTEETASFKHFYTGNTPLVSSLLASPAVGFHITVRHKVQTDGAFSLHVVAQFDEPFLMCLPHLPPAAHRGRPCHWSAAADR